MVEEARGVAGLMGVVMPAIERILDRVKGGKSINSSDITVLLLYDLISNSLPHALEGLREDLRTFNAAQVEINKGLLEIIRDMAKR